MLGLWVDDYAPVRKWVYFKRTVHQERMAKGDDKELISWRFEKYKSKNLYWQGWINHLYSVLKFRCHKFVA